MGEDPVQVADYFASRKRINHVHYRNVQVVKPYEKYQEVFIDAGMGDMFGVMKALVRNKYTGTIYPEHPRALDADRDLVAPWRPHRRLPRRRWLHRDYLQRGLHQGHDAGGPGIGLGHAGSPPISGGICRHNFHSILASKVTGRQIAESCSGG